MKEGETVLAAAAPGLADPVRTALAHSRAPADERHVAAEA